MPGTPATSPSLGLPRYAGGDPAQFAPQVNAIVDKLDDRLAGAIVTTLPTSGLVDGDECYLQSTSMATNHALWHMRYRSAISGSYKWEFVGGAPLFAGDAGLFDGTSTTAGYVTLSGIPTEVTLPSAGEYLVEAMVRVAAGANVNGWLGVQLGSETVFDDFSAGVGYTVGGTAGASLRIRKTPSAANTVVRLVFQVTGGAANFFNPSMIVHPRLLG